MRRILLNITFAVLLICTAYPLFSQDISVGGSWDLSIDVSDMQSGMISELNSTYESPADQITSSVTNSSYGWFGTWYWMVSVSRDNTQWHSALHLDVRRSSSGLGFGSVSGGTSYQEVTTTNRAFITGSRHRLWMGFQLRVRGVSSAVPAGTYSTTVTYTIVEL